MDGSPVKGMVIEKPDRRPAQAVLSRGEGMQAIPALFPGWKTDLVQLGRGRLQSCGMHVPLGGFRLTQVRLERKALLRLTAPRDQAAVFIAPVPSPPVGIGSRQIEGDRCFALGPKAQLTVIVPDGASLLAVHLKAERCGQPPGGQVEIRRLSGDHAALLAHFAKRLTAFCRPGVRSGELARLQDELGARAAPAIGSLVASALPVQPEPDEHTLRCLAVGRACAFIDSHLRKPLALQDLCSAAGVGNRTLEYGFREIFDLGPMAYLRSIRLSRAYRDLADPAMAGETVTEVANRWCFTHMGQFSKDYRLQFGESPSATLKRNRRQIDWGCGEPAWGDGRRA